MASQSQTAGPPTRPVHLYLDWDGTLSKRDTMSLLAQIVAKRNSRLQQQGVPTTQSDTDIRNTMTGFGTAWMADFAVHEHDYRPKAGDRRTFAAEKEWLASLQAVESASVRRVEATGFFEGCTLDDVDAAAAAAVESSSVELRDGWEGLFASLLERKRMNGQEGEAPGGRRLSIVTVNWSVCLIRRTILHYLRRLRLPQAYTTADLEFLTGRLEIKGNEIEGLDDKANGGSSGLLSGPQSLNIRTSADKEEALDLLIQSTKTTTTMKKGNGDMILRPTVVYVGDSCTDFGSLLAADFGICIRDEPPTGTQIELQKTLDRLGIETLPVQGRSISQEGGNHGKLLWYARDFNEIQAFIGWGERDG